MPRLLSAAAMARRDVTPVARSAFMVGVIAGRARQQAADVAARPMARASSVSFVLRTPPSFAPLALAAASAALVRLEIISASSSATLAICRNRNRPVGPSIFGKSQNRTSTPASRSWDRKCADRVRRSTLATISGTRCSRAAASALSNSGRSRRFPDSVSVNSATRFQRPPLR
jgi:hypothetical protein